MHRARLLEQLRRYTAIDASDDAQRRRIEAFVREHPQCFERTLSVGHVTGSAWLLDPSGTRVLLTHHRKLNKWLQLGGHCDGDPDVLGVALREAREESGIDAIAAIDDGIFDLDVHDIPPMGGMTLHQHYDIRFLLQVRAVADFVVSDESHALRWFSQPELAQLEMDAAVRRMAHKWKRWLESGEVASHDTVG